MINIIIKKISDEKITKWDIVKGGFLFTPIIIQILMVYGVLTFVQEFAFFIYTFITSLNYDSINQSRYLMAESYGIGKFDPEKKCILPDKQKGGNINAMNNNGENIKGESSRGTGNHDHSGSDRGKQPDDPSKIDKGKQPEGSSKKNKGKEPGANSNSESDKKGKTSKSFKKGI